VAANRSFPIQSYFSPIPAQVNSYVHHHHQFRLVFISLLLLSILMQFTVTSADPSYRDSFDSIRSANTFGPEASQQRAIRSESQVLEWNSAVQMATSGYSRYLQSNHLLTNVGKDSQMIEMLCRLDVKVDQIGLSSTSLTTSVISHTFTLLIRSSGCQIQSDPYRIHHNKLLHSYPVHITLNTAYFLHLVYLPFWYIGYVYFRLCLLIRSPVINFQLMFDF